MTKVWVCPGGIAAAGRPGGLRFRNAFLGTVAAGALSLAFGGPALATPMPVLPAGCTIDSTGTIETCIGDQHTGVTALSPPVTTLNVNSLTTAITPASGTNGITFTSAGAVTINSNTGAFGITTQGNSANGILAESYGAGAVTVTSTGNMTTAGASANGIYATNNGAGAVTVTSTGNITTAGFNAIGIDAYSQGGGAVTVTSTGNMTTQGDFAYGIFAKSAGAVTVNSTGNITTAGATAAGIYAQSTSGGAVTVTSTGNITTARNDAYGIRASANGTGAVTVTSTGNITTAGGNGYGIDASGGGAVTVISTGNITTTGTQGHGIRVFQSNNDTGAVTVTSTGNIATTGNGSAGIRITQGNTDTGAMTVTSTGNIATTGNGSAGISALGYGAIMVTSIGNISTAAGATTRGIDAFSNGAGAVTVASIGNITGQGGGMVGISAIGKNAVTLTSTGNITLLGNASTGLEAFGEGSGAVTLTSTGNVSATGSSSNAILGQSNGGPIAITIKSGTVTGGTGTEPNGGAGIFISGGTNNTLTNMGTVMAVSGLAIAGDTGNNTINNSGTVIGNVTLGSGANAFNNMTGGLFNAGATVNLGAGNALTNAGSLSPGGAGVIQTTALTGNLVQTSAGQLLTDINIGGGTSDRINVSGIANLAGGVQLQVSNITFAPWQQTIVSAAGGTTNNGLTLLASPALQAQLVFPNATDVVVKSSGLNFAAPGLNANQTALGNALNAAGQSEGLGGPIFNLLLNTTSIPGYGAALTQLSGESATGSQQTTFDAMNMFMGAMTDPFTAGRGDPVSAGGSPNAYASEGDASAYAADGRKRTDAARDAYAMFSKAPLARNYDPRWSVWAAGFGGSQSTDGNAAVGSSNTTSSIAGTVVGADYRFSPFTIAGFALAGGGTSFSVANGGGRSDLFQAGAFIRHDAGAAYITGALAYGWQDIVTNRTVTLAGTDLLRAEFNANAFSGRVEGGYRFVAPWVGGVGITPYAAAQFTTFDLPAYAETALAGSGAFALSYGAKSVTDPRSELGFRTDKSYAMVDGVLTLRGRLAWAHDYDTDRAIGATFQSLPGASFVVNGAAQASDSALVTASVEKKWLNGWSAAATFEGEFSSVTASYAGKGVVRYQW
jgi:uncharacterized protein with beta-barrel porin domain